MMKLGMICNFPSQSDIDYVKSLGLEFVEMCNNFDEDSAKFDANIANYDDMVKKAGMFIGSVGRWNSSMNKSGKVNEEQFAVVESNLENAIKTGAPTFVCGCNYDDSVSLFRNYNAAVEIFGRLLDRAKGTGTNIAVYNCDWNNFVTNAAAWQVVLGELPELKIKFDASHSYNAGRDYLRELGDWGERVAHVHIKGTVRTGGRGVDDPPAGMDDLRWSSIFAILYSRGYDGCLSIEPHSPTWSYDSRIGKPGIEFTVNYIRKFIV